ncbi:COG4648 family protein [Gilliamella sp. ESL0250]|uniref:COG4648 family protein n=1 Tax=Gilliamella sp. ESL0250 TaxID=2705036 RepID=UPI0015801B79|nr:hypothetical protein [Gilliamella sp. ESL0250]NUF48712.1 DNA gyrase subunit B [Gilliamella sp. ESL0250]
MNINKVKLIINIVTNILFVGYPFIIYLSLYYNRFSLAILYLVFSFVLRLITLPNLFSNMRWMAKTIACIGLSLALMSWLCAKYQILLFYPVLVNLLFFIAFYYSLYQPQTMVEKFARLKHANLSVEAILYIRKVTLYWCLFFIFNGAIALITCLINNMYWWTIYNGLISYILIGLFMGGEWLIRQKVQH